MGREEPHASKRSLEILLRDGHPPRRAISLPSLGPRHDKSPGPTTGALISILLEGITPYRAPPTYSRVPDPGLGSRPHGRPRHSRFARSPPDDAVQLSEHHQCLTLGARRPDSILTVDAKSQIQALDRTQPGRKKGDHDRDYVRHGTTTLFASSMSSTRSHAMASLTTNCACTVSTGSGH
jgi:hypothetical protein